MQAGPALGLDIRKVRRGVGTRGSSSRLLRKRCYMTDGGRSKGCLAIRVGTSSKLASPIGSWRSGGIKSVCPWIWVSDHALFLDVESSSFCFDSNEMIVKLLDVPLYVVAADHPLLW